VVLTAFVCAAQGRRGGRRGGFWGGGGDDGPIVRTEGEPGVLVNEDTVQTARETAPHSTEMANWTNAPGFERDVFTYARVIYKSYPGRPSWLGWINDYPDADLNLSYRLQQLTSWKANPDGRVLKLTDPRLADYPLIFMSQPGGMELRDEDVLALRRYVRNGGVLVADDFWGDRDWENFAEQIKRVLPDSHWVDLPFEHPLFHCVFDFKGPLNNLQVPSIHFWRRSRRFDGSSARVSAYRGEGSEDMHVRAWQDDRQRPMILALHNTDNGDGWEREGENEEYFHQFSETRAYPFAINLIFYVMTH
jgi:hypothetical protein